VMRMLEQERALFAWEQVSSVRKGNAKVAKDVAMYIKGMPAMVLANGLGQTLAFLLQKAGGNQTDPEYIVYDILAKWIMDRRKIYEGPRAHLMKKLIEGDRYLYQQSQEEIWALLVWLKKFSDAYLSAVEDQGGDKEQPYGKEGRS
jgi:CRISPR-associated protein Cmr5